LLTMYLLLAVMLIVTAVLPKGTDMDTRAGKALGMGHEGSIFNVHNHTLRFDDHQMPTRVVVDGAAVALTWNMVELRTQSQTSLRVPVGEGHVMWMVAASPTGPRSR
jgi:hypothetical protein